MEWKVHEIIFCFHFQSSETRFRGISTWKLQKTFQIGRFAPFSTSIMVIFGRTGSQNDREWEIGGEKLESRDGDGTITLKVVWLRLDTGWGEALAPT